MVIEKYLRHYENSEAETIFLKEVDKVYRELSDAFEGTYTWSILTNYQSLSIAITDCINIYFRIDPNIESPLRAKFTITDHPIGVDDEVVIDCLRSEMMKRILIDIIERYS